MSLKLLMDRNYKVIHNFGIRNLKNIIKYKNDLNSKNIKFFIIIELDIGNISIHGQEKKKRNNMSDVEEK